MGTSDDRASKIEELVQKLNALAEERQLILAKRETAILPSDRTWYSAKLTNIDAAIESLRNEIFMKKNVVN